VIVSQFVRDNLNATGVYDGTTTTRTIALLSRKVMSRPGLHRGSKANRTAVGRGHAEVVRVAGGP
jgi:hypothetical protein